MPASARKLLARIHPLRLARRAGELDPVQLAELAELERLLTRPLVTGQAVYASRAMRDESDGFLTHEDSK
jgi:hypothetical protein